MKRDVSLSRAETTILRAHKTTTHTAGIPIRPGLSYQLLLPQHELRVISGQSQIH